MKTKEEILEKRRHIFGNKHMELFSDAIQVCMEEYAQLYAKRQIIEELESLLDSVRSAHPEYTAEIIRDRIKEYESGASI